MKFSILRFFKNDNYVLKIYINSLLVIVLTVIHVMINSRITLNWFFVLISFASFFIITVIIKIIFMISVLHKDYKTVKGRVVKYKRFGILEYNPHIIVEFEDQNDKKKKVKSFKKLFTGLFNKYEENDEVVLLIYKKNYILKDNAYL